MGRKPTERVALMAIHTEWADAILEGRKSVEFRKRRLADDIGTVLIYATTPVKKVVGRFTIERMVSASPSVIWEEFGDVGAIDEQAFFDYYGDATSAVAILIADSERFVEPLALDDLDGSPTAPQSFAYLPALVPAPAPLLVR